MPVSKNHRPKKKSQSYKNQVSIFRGYKKIGMFLRHELPCQRKRRTIGFKPLALSIKKAITGA